MSDKNVKVTLFLRSHHTITFDCKDIKVFHNHKSNGIKDLDVVEPDEGYPAYLDLSDIVAVTIKKTLPVTGFNNRIGFDNKI